MAISNPSEAWEQFFQAEPEMSQDPTMAFLTGFQMGKMGEQERQKLYVHPNLVRIVELIHFANEHPREWATIKALMPEVVKSLETWLQPGAHGELTDDGLTRRWSSVVSETHWPGETGGSHPTSGGAEEQPTSDQHGVEGE